MLVPRIAAVFTLTLLAAACADAAPVPSDPGPGDGGERIDHQAGPSDLLL